MSRLFALALLAISFSATAQVTGKIVDAETGLPLSNAMVQVKNTSVYTLTNASGTFSLPVFIPDSLQISKLSYSSKVVFVNTAFIEITLAPSALFLDDISITAFGKTGTSQEMSASVASLPFEWGDVSVSPQKLIEINQIPGVQFEERSPGSYRFNIRGSSIRSPFDVRNVKIYWNGIPYTEPGGSSPFNLLEPSFFGSVDVIKGPSSSMYGAGNGGVISIYSQKVSPATLQAGLSLGSFGYQKFQSLIGLGDTKNSHSIRLSHTSSNGYREQSHLDRSNLGYSGYFELKEDQNLEIHLLYSNLDYGIPGGLTFTQFENDPSQARARSVETQSGVKGTNLLSSVGYSIQKDRWHFKTGMYSVLTGFDNPFILDYKKEVQVGAGQRTSVNYTHNLKKIIATHTLGTEFQDRLVKAGNYGNVAGSPDTLNFDDEIRSRTALIFYQSQWEWKKFLLVGGIGLSTLYYDVNRLWDASLDSAYRVNRSFRPEWAPRLAIHWKMNEFISSFLSYGVGFSPPTLEEFRTNEGTLNEGLNAENGKNLEWVIRAHNSAHWGVETSFFQYRLSNSIVNYSSNRGTDLFRNAGGTIQNGAEIQFWYQPLVESKEWYPKITWQYTFHDFRFSNYLVDGEDFSGSKIPGVANHTGAITLQLPHKSGLYLDAFLLIKSAIPLTNDNSVTTEPLYLTNLTLGWKKSMRLRYFENSSIEKASDLLHIFFTVQNATNQLYSLGNDINAFGGRYFQPALPRNYIFGINYSFNK